MAENLVYSVFNKAQTEEIVHSQNRRDSLRKVFKFSVDSEKDEILLDFYESFISFCMKQDFTLEKISCSLAIVSSIIQSSISHLTPVSSSEESLNSLLLKHSIQRPPYSVQVFAQSDIAALRSYMESTYFKHYSLYSYGFTPHKDVIITTEKLYCATFPPVLSLAESNEIQPDSILEFKQFMPRTITPKETRPDSKEKVLEESHEDNSDPLQSYLNNEIKAMKALMEEKVRKQDEEIFNKIELLKK